ncbi:MAG: hypothetical protein H0T89_07770 [Deltaproteobacteria bacterium]|nr:hypothetical protein [Deltaproteobacteria bacterium]MDQ3297036.1 hypothetical protein [Myxococcota bacterium]
MIWRIGTRWLVACGESFVLVEPDGAVSRHFDPRIASDEDDLWRWGHVVVGDALYERTTVERYMAITRQEDELVLAGLVRDDDPATRAFVATVLGDDLVIQEETRLHAARVADARVAAIAGARDDHRLGADIARAQAALVDRVRWYGDRIAAGLLQTLVNLARARPGPGVATAYARACLLACFAHDAPAAPATVEPLSAELAAELVARARELDDEAETQDNVDARATAAAYHGAAIAMRAAAGI